MASKLVLSQLLVDVDWSNLGIGFIGCSFTIGLLLDWIHWGVNHHWTFIGLDSLGSRLSLDYHWIGFIGVSNIIGLSLDWVHWGVFFIGLDWIGGTLDSNSVDKIGTER